MRGVYWLLVGLIVTPVSAQTVRDKNGDPRFHLQQLGERTYRRDNAGNPHGYTIRRSDGTIEYRDNAGNLVGTERPH